MNMISKVYAKAKSDGRLCTRCGWIVTKADWKKGFKECFGCRDAARGVNVPPKYGKWRDEPIERTGEMQ